MMAKPMSSTAFCRIIRAGWEFRARLAAGDPEALRQQADADARLAATAAAERAHYEALTPEARAAYDRLTEGMMPRLRR